MLRRICEAGGVSDRQSIGHLSNCGQICVSVSSLRTPISVKTTLGETPVNRKKGGFDNLSGGKSGCPLPSIEVCCQRSAGPTAAEVGNHTSPSPLIHVGSSVLGCRVVRRYRRPNEKSAKHNPQPADSLQSPTAETASKPPSSPKSPEPTSQTPNKRNASRKLSLSLTKWFYEVTVEMLVIGWVKG